MSTDSVSDRTLERMTVGELSDDEAREVLLRLEAEEGGPERLERLLAEREEFLRANPPEVVAPQIVRMAGARRTDDSTSLEDARDFRMLAPQLTRSFALAGAAAVAVTLIVVGFFVLDAERGPEPPPTNEIAASDPGETTPAAGAPLQVDVPEETPPEGLRVVRWDGRSNTSAPLGTVVDGRRVLLLATDQIVTLQTDGVGNIAIEPPGVAELSGSETVGYLEGLEAGETRLVVTDPDRHEVDVVVADELERTLVEEHVVQERDRFEKCFRGSGAGVVKVRFLVDGGDVPIAQPEFSDVEQSVADCVVDHVSGWQFEGVSGRKTGSYRFAANAAGLCEPGEDC